MISIHRPLASARVLALGLVAALSLALADPAHAAAAAMPMVVVVESSLVYEEVMPAEMPARTMRIMRGRSDLSCRAKRGTASTRPATKPATKPATSVTRAPKLGRR